MPRTPRTATAAAAALLLLLLAGCPQPPTGTFPRDDDDASGPDDDDATSDDDDATSDDDDDDATGDDDDSAADPCDGVATTSGTDVSLELVTDAVFAPTFITHAGDGSDRLFVVEQTGVIRTWTETDGVAEWLDIDSNVVCCGELGLLGLAFHPDFASNGRFFLSYNASTSGGWESRITEMNVDLNGDPVLSSELVLLTLDQPAGNHNGGMIAFGPDGYLYIGFGDGGGAGDTYDNGQEPDTLHAKILRIDVDNGDPYDVPIDNPFVEVDGHRPETWAWGLRNPWRFSFDRETGELWIGDVGQGAHEEIDIGVAGANYGWPETEGFSCYASGCDPTLFEAPVWDYPRSDGISVTGGYVYRGCEFPDLAGTYFFSDYNYFNSPLYSLSWDGATAGTGPAAIAFTGSVVSSFGEDEAGELYLADHVGGAVYKLVVD